MTEKMIMIAGNAILLGAVFVMTLNDTRILANEVIKVSKKQVFAKPAAALMRMRISSKGYKPEKLINEEVDE